MNKLTEGSIVVLAKLPDVKWIVHNGWYTYRGVLEEGWYFSSIPKQEIMPMTDESLVGIKIIPGGCEMPDGPPCIPKPPVTTDCRYTLDRAAISVKNIQERDALNYRKFLPDGKLVRVNECPDGKTRYFVWDLETKRWEIEEFGQGYSKEEADARFALKDEIGEEVRQQASIIVPEIVNQEISSIQQDITNIDNRVTIIESSAEWVPLAESGA